MTILPKLLELVENISEQDQLALYKELIEKPIKRKYIRRKFDKEIGYVVSGKEYIDVARDLSFEGVFIETANRFHVGQSIKLEIPVGNTPKIIRTTGVIVRVAADGIGVKLTKDKKYQDE